jgi:hypothetical protein
MNKHRNFGGGYPTSNGKYESVRSSSISNHPVGGGGPMSTGGISDRDGTKSVKLGFGGGNSEYAGGALSTVANSNF